MTRLLLLVPLLLFGACREQRPPAPTAAEARQLDEAEAMLNEANEKGPGDRSPGPSNESDN